MEPHNCYNIISLNSGGLRTKERFDTALQFCKNSGAEFSVLQETHLGPAKYSDIKKTMATRNVCLTGHYFSGWDITFSK